MNYIKVMVMGGFFAMAITALVLPWPEAQAQAPEWRDLGSINGCALHQRGICYALLCDNGQAALSCR